MLVDRAGGLNLADPESWTPEEQEAWTAFYMETKHGTMPGHDFWIATRPDVLKRYRHQAIVMETRDDPGAMATKVGPLTFLHYYAVIGYGDGVHYQIINALERGRATKKEIVAVLAVAFMHSGPLGMRYVADSQAFLESVEDPADPSGWPDGWDIDPDAFRSGLDFGTEELSPEEAELLEAWYLRVCGEVPRQVRFWLTYRPAYLKAMRHRFEFALKDGLPKQMMPLLLLHLHACRGFGPGIREAAQMARGLGVKKTVAVDAVARAAIYSGTAGTGVVDEFAGDVFADPAWA